MSGTRDQGNILGTMPVDRLVLTMSAPIMVSMLVSAVYNLVDSIYVAQVSDLDFLALSYAYPVQLMMVAFCTGIGVGFNATFAQRLGEGKGEEANRVACHGFLFYTLCWLLFLAFALFGAPLFFRLSTDDPVVARAGVEYLTICCGASIGMCMQFLTERLLQTTGHPTGFMIVQGSGAVLNIVLDPVFIFGLDMGVAGAAYATVAGQVLAAVIVSSGFRRPPAPRLFLAYAARIYQLGYPSIFMQMLFTVYIMALNLILAGFSDAAVTVLGLYYKVQSFFFIPLNGLQTCIVPLLSYTYAKGAYSRCQRVVKDSIVLAMVFMLVGIACFELIPAQLLGLFTSEPEVFAIGTHAFHIIGLSFLPAVLSLIFPVFFQAIGAALPSILLSLTRQIFCLIPVFWFFSRIDLSYAWFAFPIAEVITGTLGLIFYARRVHIWGRLEQAAQTARRKGAVVMKMITAIINKRDSGEVCAALTEAGYYFTRMSSTGGFLTGGNTTLLIGTPEERVPQAISIIREHCSRRTEKISSNVQLATPSAPYPTEVTVGGATLFVSDVTQFEKI